MEKLIYKRSEGDELKPGIYFQRDKFTKLAVGVVFPVWYKQRREFIDFDTGDLITAWSLRMLHVGFRINAKNVLFKRFKTFWVYYNIHLLKTEGEIKDNILLSLLRLYKYTYDWDREVYFNKEHNKIFSIEFLLQKPLKDIEHAFKVPVQELAIYFTNEPSEYVMQEILKALKWNTGSPCAS